MSRLVATYRVAAPPERIEALAEALALEQSVEVPASVVRDPYVAEQVAGRVTAIRRCGEALHEVDVALATITTGREPAQLLNMLFGNTSLQPGVELLDVAWPDDLLAAFAGPRFGIAGLRALTAVHGRPLTCAALKPQGLPASRLADLCYTLACAGLDVIKDDHGLADQPYAPFAERVAACQRAISRAADDTGRRALYAPSLVGGPRRLREQAEVARAEGAAMVLVAPALVGLPAFAELVAQPLGVPVLAHPALAGATRIAPPLVLGRIFRLFGADAVIFPHAGGRFAYDHATCAAIASGARAPWSTLAPALPVPAGGMSVERVGELVTAYGNDAMLLVGGSLLLDPHGVAARARAFCDGVTAAARAAATTVAA